MRQLLDKVQENSNYITAQRQKATFGVADTAAVVSLGGGFKDGNCPLEVLIPNNRFLRGKKSLVSLKC